MGNVEIFEIVKDDLSDLSVAEIVCFAEDSWSYDSLERALSSPSFYGICAKKDGVLLGYISLFEVLDEGQINNIAVLPDYRKSGIATMLLEKAIADAKEKKLNFLTLEVREGNTPARKLYEKFGFVEVGKRTNYYKNPTENAILYTNFL